MRSKFYIVFLLALLLSSCNLVSKEVITWMDTDVSVDYPTKVHLLEEDAIKITLPIDFERYSLYDSQRRLDSAATKKHHKAKVARINAQMKMEGNLYLYFDSLNNSSYIINSLSTVPFMIKFDNTVAKMVF